MSCGCNLRKRITIKNIELDNKRDIYLDYNSTTKPDTEILALTDRINRNLWGNPSSQNSRGVLIYNSLLKEIHEVKKLLKIPEYNPYFDTSATSIIEKIAAYVNRRKIITSSIEHQSLLKKSSHHITVDSNGQINLNILEKILSNSKDKKIIIYSPVNHETGSIQKCKDIYKLASKYRTNVILDCVQAISRLETSKWLPYCDGFYFSGHKIYGLQGSALLFLKKGIIDFKTEDSPIPFSLYSGTFNTPSSFAILYACKKIFINFQDYITELKALHEDAKRILLKLSPDIKIESPEDSAPGIINISIPKTKSIEELMLYLNTKGIQISRLSSCSGDINDDSYILKEMGRDSSSYKKSLRISFGKDSKRDDFYRLSSALHNYLSSLKQ